MEISSVSYKLAPEEFWQFSCEPLHSWTPGWFGAWDCSTGEVNCTCLGVHRKRAGPAGCAESTTRSGRNKVLHCMSE